MLSYNYIDMCIVSITSYIISHVDHYLFFLFVLLALCVMLVFS